MANYDEDRIYGVIDKVVTRKLGMFAAYPWWGKEDLISEARIAVRRALPRFNKKKGALSTFVYTVATRRLIDISIKLGKEAKRDNDTAKPGFEILPSESNSSDVDEDMADWLGAIYRRANRVFSNYQMAAVHGRGRPCIFNRAQIVALMALKARLHLSCRGMEMVIGSRPDFRSAVRLARVPSRQFFCRAEKAVTKISFDDSSDMRAMAG